MLMRYYKK